uniref:Uncharacterized protein n=1 Tax=Acrobeloides nanus TaxID=290746 RepID=A0A914D7P5_9BILA
MCLMMIFNVDFGPIIGKVKRGYLDRTATGLGEELVRGTGTGIWNRVRYVRQGYGGQEQRDTDRTMKFSMKKRTETWDRYVRQEPIIRRETVKHGLSDIRMAVITSFDIHFGTKSQRFPSGFSGEQEKSTI